LHDERPQIVRGISLVDVGQDSSFSTGAALQGRGRQRAVAAVLSS
jgi:hypothetical protein